MSRKFAYFFVALLICTPAFAVQTGGAGAANPVVITGAITAEGYSKAPTLEITSGVTKLGSPTYTWPASLGSANSFLKDGGSGALVWETISGTVPDPTAAGSLLVGSDAAGSWQSQSVSGDITMTSTGVTTIAAGAVTTDEIAAGSINAAKIADGVITGAKLTSDIVITTSGSVAATSFAGAHYGDGSALTGVSATTAETAGSAGYATTAGSATSATTAETAGSAGYATTAGSATSATTAETAGSATPSGAAGGDLTGTYPDPTIGNNKIVAAYMATNSVTSDAIADLNVTGTKLADQIVKSGSLDDAAYSIILSNEGTGAVVIPELPAPMTSAFFMKNSAATGGLALIDAGSEFLPGALLIGNNNSMFVTSPLTLISGDSMNLSSPNMILSTENPDGSIKFISDDGEEPPTITEIMTLDYDGTVTVHNLSPSLYVKTDVSSNLTAEAIDLSSGMSGTLGALYGGTGISSYPPSGEILIGDGTNYNLRIISGDVSMNYLGEVAIRDGRISTQKLTSDFVLPYNKGGTGITTAPMGPQLLVGYMGSYSLRTVSGDVTMDYLGNYTIGSGKITADKLASNFTLPVNRGGTGATIYPTGEIVFGSGTAPLGSSSNFTWDNSNQQLVIGQKPGFIGSPDPGFITGADDYITLGGFSAGGDAAMILGAAGGTIASPTALQEEDSLGALIFAGYDGTEAKMGAGVAAEATQNWGGSAQGTSLTLFTANDDDTGVTALMMSNNLVATNANLNVLGSASIGSTLEVSGSAVYVPGGDYIISDAGIGADLLGSKVLLIKGDSSLTDVTANPQIAAGADGQMLILIGRDDTALVKFNNGNGLQLSAATSFTMGIGDVLQLVYVQSIGKWVEISRTDN